MITVALQFLAIIVICYGARILMKWLKYWARHFEPPKSDD